MYCKSDLVYVKYLMVVVVLCFRGIWVLVIDEFNDVVLVRKGVVDILVGLCKLSNDFNLSIVVVGIEVVFYVLLYDL